MILRYWYGVKLSYLNKWFGSNVIKVKNLEAGFIDNRADNKLVEIMNRFNR